MTDDPGFRAHTTDKIDEIQHALFGYSLRNEPGLIRQVTELAKTTDKIEQNQEKLMELVPIMNRLADAETERARHELYEEKNRLSRGLGQVASMFAVILIITPLVVDGIKPQWVDENPLVVPLILLVFVAAFGFSSYLTHRNGNA